MDDEMNTAEVLRDEHNAASRAGFRGDRRYALHGLGGFELSDALLRGLCYSRPSSYG